METAKIKKMIKKIIQDGSGMAYDDDGNGCGGPGFADAGTLLEMWRLRNFDDAHVVDFDNAHARDTIGLFCEFDEDTDWIQIEFNCHDDGYHQIGWIWEV